MRNPNGTFMKGVKNRVTHGKTRTKVYKIWTGLKTRCLNPASPAFHDYGGRGITVCDRWLSFENFYADMGDVPDGMSIDRIDNNGPYSPENCRWAERKTQMRNRRNRFEITVSGETRSAVEWAEISGIDDRTIRARIRKGWPPEAAVFAPLITKRKGIPRGKRLLEFQDGGEDMGPLFNG